MANNALFDTVSSMVKSGSDRLKRASNSGFDTDRTLYHWTEAENIEEFKPSTRGKLGAGIYTLPESKSGQRYVDVNSGSANVIPMHARGPIAKAADTDVASLQARQNLGSEFSGSQWNAETNRILQEQGFTGREVGGAQPEINIFDSKDLRSVHAAFKDPSSKNIMAGTAATAVGAGALMSPQEVVANTFPVQEDYNHIGPRDVGLRESLRNGLAEILGGDRSDYRTAEDLMGLGDFLPVIGDAQGAVDTADSFNQGDYIGTGVNGLATLLGSVPLIGDAASKALKKNKDNIRGALEMPEVNRDTQLLQRVGDPDSVNGLEVTYEAGADLAPNDLLKAEDIINRPYVSTMADTSRGGLETLSSINGEEYSAIMHGGQDYMRQPYNFNKGILWASDQKAIPSMFNAANAAGELKGASGSPLFMPYQMGGQSTDFATMSTDIMVPYASKNMSKKAKKALDKRIREGKGKKRGLPDWVGIDHPDAQTYLLNGGAKRKDVMNALDEFRDEGSLSLSQVRAMIVDPQQTTPSAGQILNVGEFNLGSLPTKGNHPTYNMDLRGQHLGRVNSGFNIVEANPIRRSDMASFPEVWRGKGYDIDGALPSPVQKAMQGGMIGVLNQPIVDDMVKRGIVAP